MMGSTPWAARPVAIRPTSLDLPTPGMPSTTIEGLAIRPALRNQLTGSEHTVAPVRMSAPDRDADHRGPGSSGERPEPTELGRGRPPLGGAR